MNQKINKYAVGYIRCSTDEQTLDSVPRQRTEIERWAKSNDYIVARFFVDDGVSGMIPLGERPAGGNLIDEIRKNKDIRFVIIWEYSRWGRDADSEQIYFWELLLNQSGVKLISLDNPELTFKSSMERGIMRFVQRQTSTQENKSKSLRSYSGAKRNIELGYLNTNSPPYGYVRAAKNISNGSVRILEKGELVQTKLEKPYLAINSSETETVLRIFEQRARGISLRKIAQMLNVDNIPSAKGKRWRKNVLDRIIRNPVYYGAACWHKTTSSRIAAYEEGFNVPRNVSRFIRKNDRSHWILNEQAGLPQIVTRELWEKANSYFSISRTRGSRVSSSRYLLSGLIFCAKSGCRFVGSDGGHSKRKDNTILKKRYYINNNWHSQGILEGVRSVNADALEKKVFDFLKENILSKTIADRVEKLVDERVRDHRSQASEQITIQRIDRQIQEKEDAVQNLIRAIKIANDVEALIPALRVAEKEKQELETERERVRLREREIIPEKLNIGEIVARQLLEFEKVLDNSVIEDKKSFIRRWIEKIEVFEKEGKKIARAFSYVLPKLPEFQQIHDKFVLPSPSIKSCRAHSFSLSEPSS